MDEWMAWLMEEGDLLPLMEMKYDAVPRVR